MKSDHLLFFLCEPNTDFFVVGLDLKYLIFIFIWGLDMSLMSLIIEVTDACTQAEQNLLQITVGCKNNFLCLN